MDRGLDGRSGRTRLVTSLIAGLLGAAPAAAQVPPLQVGGDARVDPSAFRSTVFATGLDYPYGMQELADGSLLVGTSRPDPGGGFFQSTGELVRLVDADGDGVADAPPALAYTGLPGAVTAVRASGSLVFVTSAQFGRERISILRLGATAASPLTLVGWLDFHFPYGWWHTTYALAVQRSPGRPREHLVFFNVGSSDNAAQSAVDVTVTGLADARLRGASLYVLALSDLGARGLRVHSLRQVASGLRNAAGIAVQPETGDLLFADNGIDDPAFGGEEPLSADELNRLSRSQIRSPAVESFGFPGTYTRYRTGAVVGGAGMAPLITFQPLGAAASESEGAAEIALSPVGFPAGLDHGVFVGFHGKFDDGGLANEENPVVYADLDTGQYFHFIGNDEPFVGHLDALLATADSLFLADISSQGSVGPEGAGTGVIYQVKARRH